MKKNSSKAPADAALKQHNKKLLKKEIWKHRELFLMMIPALIATFIFRYVPMYGVIMSFQNVRIGDKFGQSEWVGLYNFKRFFNGAWVGIIIKNTIGISLLSMLMFPFPLFLSLLLFNTDHPRLKKFTQTATYLPHLLSLVLVVSIVNVFCAGSSGLINIFLKSVGLEKINFFGDPKWVFPLYLISGVWANCGYDAIVYLGALASVDNDQIEASMIDGASKLQRIWYIQLPTILPTVMTMLVLNVGSMFAIGADKMLLLQTDLNIKRSEIISTYIYKAGIQNSQYGFSTAVGLFQSVINLFMVILVNKVSKKTTGVNVI